MITVREAKSRRELLEFIEFPNRLYAGVPQYVPSLVMDELSNLSPKKNPAFEYCDMRFFLAEKEGEVVGRIAVLSAISQRPLAGKKAAYYTHGFYRGLCRI